jgi:7-cyano-7-deazaguanine synthase
LPAFAHRRPVRHRTAEQFGTFMEALAVLVSGGLDSAILLGDALSKQALVYPIYIHCGLHWEATEFDYLRRYLQAIRTPRLQSLTMLALPVADLYAKHWSITGQGIPDAQAPDEDVFLPGRNLLLLAKALIWCHLQKIPALALGCLGTSPFPDARPAFFKEMERVADQSVTGSVKIVLPFAGMKKVDVMRLGRDQPLEHTFSCIDPVDNRHCGRCNKCAERRRAFADAGMKDPTEYGL